MESYNTLSETMEALRAEGYIEDFNIKDNHLESQSGQFQILHHEFEIDKFFRFEGETDPADESILYAISSKKYNVKGVLVNAYGIYSNSLEDELLRKLAFGHE
ncbi:phosphoribosylpyrophosphate synthetase [Dyadobacter psychrotolerans]|uniref:Phosphoribosylpyrophosphate synthetase n=1 Tax=Dyadobacter psychrotolerans TaxID=2541721 RepID=A0A4R5DSF9_9BACT|nr:phosphoribosylpyrophosphate synthetase [Dyadobacter psychrotolerans]TDE16667.1 phosphoribosylpyrophosphate synthetase [Dyadobacter psychrotolerans]